MKVAAIDVGTNSVHLLVAEVGPNGETKQIVKDRAQVELGRGGLASGRLTDDAMQRGIDALATFGHTIDALQVDAVVAAATSAVREAENGRQFVRAVRRATGIHIRVISGVDEAKLIYQGLRPEIDFSRGYAALVDIGGGSVELSLCDPTQVLASHSLPMGHLRMTEAFVRSDPPTKAELKEIRNAAQEQLLPVLRDIRPGSAGTLLGTSGSVRTLARMATFLRGQTEPTHDHGLVLYRKDLTQLIDHFTAMSRSELVSMGGMDPRRRRTIPAAATVLRQIMKTLELDPLVTSDRSLRDGLLAGWILENEPELALSKTVPWPTLRTVQRMRDRFDVDQAHSSHVRDLALAMFDGLNALGEHGLRLDAEARLSLEHAALLHDIGHHISGRDHHKHGEYLVRHARMPGFTAPEVALVANVIRYHRRRPKLAHDHFRALSPTRQRTVEILSAILRMADTLDHAHNQAIVDLAIEESGSAVVIRAQTRSDAHIERWAADRRKARLSNVLNRPVTVVLEPHRPA